jgi:uncharacterized protein
LNNGGARPNFGSWKRGDEGLAMNVDEAMRRFAGRGEFPREALQWALDNWDEASPRLIAKLRAYAGGARPNDGDLDVLVYVIHLCGEKRDPRAYVPLCDVIANDETFDVWFGETSTGNLAPILINLCDGDVEPLQRAIEAPEADEFARAAAMEALAYLVRAKSVLSDDEMRTYLSRLAREMQPRGENAVWQAWAFAIAQLGYEPLRGEVARLFSKRWIDSRDASLDEFYEDLQKARKDPLGTAAFSASGIEPFGSAIEALEGWSYGEDEEWEGAVGDAEDAEDGFDIEAGPPLVEALPINNGTPYVNPLREVGRNDPCPCGSGKKYKKCCLAA